MTTPAPARFGHNFGEARAVKAKCVTRELNLKPAMRNHSRLFLTADECTATLTDEACQVILALTLPEAPGPNIAMKTLTQAALSLIDAWAEYDGTASSFILDQAELDRHA